MKKIIGVFFSFILMLSLSFMHQTMVDAQGIKRIPENASIVTYGRICSCGGTHYLYATSYGEPEIIRQEKCTSRNWGTDLIKERTITKTYRCSSCGNEYELQSTETIRDCHGYDK